MSGPYTQLEGFQGALGIDTANPVTKGFEFENADVVMTQEIIDTTGIRGTREHYSFRTRAGKQTFGGPINFQPSAEDLELLIPWITGSAFASNISVVADTLTSRYVTIDKVAAVFTYAGMYVNKATFSAAEGTEMKLALELMGMSETQADAGSFPSVTYANTNPFMFSDAVMTLSGSSRNIKDFTLVIDNMLEVLYNNSNSPTSIISKDRNITFTCQNPFSVADLALYNQDPDGAAASLVLTDNNSNVLTFGMNTLQVPAKGPGVPGRQALYLPIEGVVRSSAAGTPSLSITLALS